MHNIKGRTEGSLVVNGISLKPKYLGDRIAYVCEHQLQPNLTVEEHLKLISSLVKPATNAFRTKSMVRFNNNKIKRLLKFGKLMILDSTADTDLGFNSISKSANRRSWQNGEATSESSLPNPP